MSVTASIPSTSEDWMIWKIRGQLDEWHIRSFENYTAFSMIVRRATNLHQELRERSQKIWPGSTIIFVDIWSSAPRIVHVRVSSEQVVQVICAMKWTPLTEWLYRIRLEFSSDDWQNLGFRYQSLQAHRLARQREWWSKNGKSFPFLKLPSELRIMFYDMMIPDTLHPYQKSRHHQSSGIGGFRWSQPFMQLVTASKQIYQESSRTLHNRPFHVRYFHTLLPLLTRKAQRDRLTRLELSLSHWDMSKTFILHPAYGNIWTRLPAGPIRYLQTMELQQITIRIAPPSDSTAARMFDGACQNDVVDFLFDSMWCWLRGQTVKIVGYVKDGQRRKFEDRCTEEAKLVKKWRQTAKVMDKDNSSIKDYYDWQEWLALEQDGGVWLDGRETVPETKKPELSESDSDKDSSDGFEEDSDDDTPVFHCSCVPRCHISTWTNKGLEVAEEQMS